ncbi:VrrA/YqfQ family protein [Sporosarcina sp. BP05]|uniref:VrrA/YqfQ family protein n=1 Tax=Sporosarcina sp. BP05 TaxID=2758726 RepID=UPI0016464AA4|nr:VrrA/YqfQ family protein [Sporosarcina sp. BP05]
MRYESFYPFARQQSQPTSMGQTSFGPPSQMRQQTPRQPFMNDPMGNPFGGQTGNPPGGPMGNPAGGPMAGQGEQQVPSKMESYMQTANQFLNTAQQFAPVVQQFAPMVQNLPAMWRLYKGFQSLPVAGAASLPVSGGVSAARSVANVASGLSAPRIFQPPIR